MIDKKLKQIFTIKRIIFLTIVFTLIIGFGGIEIAKADALYDDSYTKVLLAQKSCQVSKFETQVFKLTNQARKQYKLKPLRWNCQLIIAAQSHSQDMGKHKKMSHVGSDGSTVERRAKKTGYSSSYVGENVACGQKTPQAVVKSWMNSSGHRRNILKANYTEIGVGYNSVPNDRCGSYWTQVFGRR